MEKIRAFIAIELPEEIKRAFIRLQNKLKSGSQAPVRWVSPNATHLTLQFLGDTDIALVPQIVMAMQATAHDIHPFHLGVGGLGVFPDTRRVRVIWVGLNGQLDVLATLQKRVEASLQPLGFTPEARAFTPHLTLGRMRDNARPDERQSLGELVARTPAAGETRFDVKTFHLIRSQLRPQGPLYTIIGSAQLK